MISFLKYFVPFVLVCGFVNSITLLQHKILVQEGCSYFQMVTDTNLAISRCTAIFRQNNSDVLISLDLHSNNVNFSDNFKDSINFKSRIQSLGFGRCGFKIDNSTFQDPQKWILVVTSSVPEKTFNSSFTVGMYHSKQTAPLHSVKPVHFGITTTILCGIEYTPRLFCYLYNPLGELVSNECTYTFVPTLDDIGTWSCNVGVVQRTEALKYTIDVKIEGKSTTHNWIDETDEHVSFGCRITNWKRYEPPNYCIMTSPSGEKLLLKPGHATSRYTSIYTNLKENICGLEIKKPLLDSEKGLWICEIDNRGNVILVGNETDSSFKKVAINPIKTNPREKFLFSCKVPDSYSNCFVISPKGQKFLPNIAPRTELGECSVTVGKADAKLHNGTWTCYFIKDNEMIAYKQQREVIVSSLLCSNDYQYLSPGTDVSRSCSTGGNPISYCWAISPKGNTYNLKSGFKNSNVSYVGEGLDRGDCGIKIENIQEDDFGEWFFVLVDNVKQREISFHIKKY